MTDEADAAGDETPGDDEEGGEADATSRVGTSSGDEPPNGDGTASGADTREDHDSASDAGSRRSGGSSADVTSTTDVEPTARSPEGGGDDAPADAEPDSRAGLGFGSSTGVDPASIDPSELTVPERSLDPRIRVIWVAQSVFVAVAAGALAWLPVAFGPFDVGLLLPAGVAAAFLAIGVTHALLRYRFWRYEVREDALYLERGVVTRVRTVVPFVRIQHVDTSRGPIERAVGLATSVVYTAGSRGADVTIPGLEADRAEDLQRRLKRLAIASEGDTAV